jgi:predicted nucleic acid-binding protein
MPSNRVGFRPFLNKIQDNQKLNIVIDSNALIANWDEAHSNYDEVRNFMEQLDNKADVTFYTTVTTKAEFLDYQRRRLLSNGILSLEGMSEITLSASAKAKISTVKGRRVTREKNEIKRSEKDGDPVDSSYFYFRDSELKEIKRSFRALDVQNETGWLKICDVFLYDILTKEEKLINEFCTYLSIHNSDQKHLFINDTIDWKNATALSAKTGMGFSDSMILNMFLETKIDYLLTLDFDLVYASAISANHKTVILPDKRIGDFKKILKKVH